MLKDPPCEGLCIIPANLPRDVLLESILTPSHPLDLSSGHALSSVGKYRRSITHISRPITHYIPGLVLADMKFRDSGNGFGRLATSRKGCGIRARPPQYAFRRAVQKVFKSSSNMVAALNRASVSNWQTSIGFT